MSRAEKKLAKIKAEEELERIKQEKKRQKLEKQKKAREDWNNSSKETKIATIVITIIIGVAILWAIIASSNNAQDNMRSSETTHATQETEKEESKPKTAKELMFDKVLGLIDTKDAFDTGSYTKGDIPVGEYAYVPFDGSGKYYSEKDSAGNIIDNENFDSFGYVFVQGAGNLETQGVLIKIGAFKKLSVKSAKEIYEKLNDIKDYEESAYYKVGTDIAPGTYIIQSFSEGYAAVLSGPVGNSDIVDNENFNGKYSVSVSVGQYLKVSRGKLL